MSQLNDTRQGSPPSDLLPLDQYPLVPVDEQDLTDSETWLFVLRVRASNKVAFAPEASLSGLNSTINLKDPSEWMENVNPSDILLREIPEIVPENEHSKIIDTRTFTRPRKGRMSSSPLQPASTEPECLNTTTNLNSTFNFKGTVGQNGADVLNATVVIEEAATKEAELNATFHVDQMMNGGTPEAQISPCNNNVYNLNNTFTAASTPSHVNVRVKSSVALNATYSEDATGSVESTAGRNLHLQHSLDEMEEYEEEGLDQMDEAVFRRPLLPGAVPKKTPLIRTSTLNSDSPANNGAEPHISPPAAYDPDRLAKLQGGGVAQTSTPMGQRQLGGLRRPAEADYLGSPITSMVADPADGTINYGPPIPINTSLTGNANSPDATLDNSNHVVRGQLTYEKSQHSVEGPSGSPTSPADSPYSSQSLESDAGQQPATAQDLLRRSMPNLNNASRLRMPQPSTSGSNLNRQQHTSSDSGLRPPSAGISGIRPPVGRPVNGPLLRPPAVQSVPPPQPPVAIPNAVKPNQQPQPQRSAMPAPRSSLMPASTRLKQPQLAAPTRSSLPAQGPLKPAGVAVRHASGGGGAEDLNSTVVVEKPVAVAAPPPVLSGIPRPASLVSRIPGPRTTLKSSIPTMAFRPRGPTTH